MHTRSLAPLLFALALLGAGSPANAADAPPAGAPDIWRWTDRFGHLHYTPKIDIPPERRAFAEPASAPLPPGTTACDAAWNRYRANQACFDAFRVVGGGLKPDAFRYCQELPQPQPCR